MSVYIQASIDIPDDKMAEAMDAFPDFSVDCPLVEITYSVPDDGIENEKLVFDQFDGDANCWYNENDNDAYASISTLCLPFNTYANHTATVKMVLKSGGTFHMGR